MKEYFENSLIVRWLTAAAQWLDRQWSKSRLSRLFAEPAPREGGSVLGRLTLRVHLLLCRLFGALRLDRLLRGSVLTRTEFWVLLTLLTAPILPTMAVLGICLVGFVSVAAAYGLDPERRMPRTPVTKWIAAFALIYLVGTFTSVTVAGSFKGGILTAAFTLFGLAVPDALRSRKQVERAFRVLVISGAVVALYGLFQAVVGVEGTGVWFDSSSFKNMSLRVYSTLENPNVLSEFLLLMIPLGVVWTLTCEKRGGRLLPAACTAVMLLCLLMTYARGGYLGLAFAAAVFLVLLDRRFIILGVLGILALLAVMPQSIIDRLSSIGDLSDSSTMYRVYIWSATLDLLRDNGLFGIGTGVAAFKAVYGRYSFNAVDAPHAHNLYLQITCECGIPGIVTLMGAVFACIRELGRSLRAGDRGLKLWSAAMIASMAGFLVQSLTEHSFYNYRVTLVFWCMIGLGAALARCRFDSRGDEK